MDRLDSRLVSLNFRMDALMASLDGLLANARAMDTRIKSVAALLTDLRAQITGVKMPADAQTKIDEIFGVMQGDIAAVTNALQPPGAPVEVAEPAPAPAPAPAPPTTPDTPPPSPAPTA